MVVEVQLHGDRDKRWSRPVYVTTLRARLQCPVELLVICPRAKVAAWCAAPMLLGVSGAQITPLVLGPDLVPVVTDVAEAGRFPELAVLSAIAHGDGAERRTVLLALLGGLRIVGSQDRHLYLELVHTALPERARRYLEEIMSTYADKELSSLDRYVLKRSEARGRSAGEAQAVLTFLDARGIAVSDEQRALITGCSDLDQLDAWVRRAATATTVEDLFD